MWQYSNCGVDAVHLCQSAKEVLSAPAAQLPWRGNVNTIFYKERNMLYLMNSAMMPQDGVYHKETITPSEAKELFNGAGCMWKSTIGYPNTKKIVDQVLSADIPLCRDSVQFESGDDSIVFSLKYRILSPEEKAANTHGSKLEDYIISRVAYKAIIDKPCVLKFKD